MWLSGVTLSLEFVEIIKSCHYHVALTLSLASA